MITDVEVLLALVVAASVIGIVKEARARLAATGLLRFLWRWHTGQPWHGKPITNRGWTRKGTPPALTRTGFAPRFHYRPRWQQTVMRTTPSLVLVLSLMALVQDPGPTVIALVTSVIAGIVFLIWRTWWRLRRRKHRRTWLEPLHLQAAPIVGIPIANKPESWLQIAQDRSTVKLALPPGFQTEPKEIDRITRVVTTKLGDGTLELKPHLAGPEPYLLYEKPQPVPDVVRLADVMPAIEKAADDDLIWGLGKRRTVVKNSLSGDSPHFGLSMGSGAGKSRTARALLAQMLHRGAIGVILDYKMISHQWARGLPNVVIYRRPHEIHAALLWLGKELERRNEVAEVGSDDEGEVHAVVGPRIIVICEELNATMSRLRKHWEEMREADKSLPKRSPALNALDSMSFMGRQVLCNIIYISQRLSVKAAGGDGDARENIGVIAFSRFSASNWKMLAGDHPKPPNSLHPGRLQVVAAEVTEVQCVKMSAKEAKQLATSGRVALLPAGMPGAPRVTAAPLTGIPGPDQQVVTVTAPLEPPPVTGPAGVSLREALELKIVPEGHTIYSLRQERHRAKKRGEWLEPVGYHGLDHLYDAEELSNYFAVKELERHANGESGRR